jgi:fumarate hydratase, class II
LVASFRVGAVIAPRSAPFLVKDGATVLQVNRKRVSQLLNESLMLVTALNNKVGYDNAAAAAKKAHKEGTTLKEAATALGIVSPENFDKWVRPELMISPTK